MSVGSLEKQKRVNINLIQKDPRGMCVWLQSGSGDAMPKQLLPTGSVRACMRAGGRNQMVPESLFPPWEGGGREGKGGRPICLESRLRAETKQQVPEESLRHGAAFLWVVKYEIESGSWAYTRE